VLQVKPEEEDAKETTSHPTCCLGKLHLNKHLIVTVGHLAMEKQDCLLKHMTCRQSQQSSSFRYREKMFIFILWSTSPLALPPLFIPLPSGIAHSMDTNQGSCCFNDQEKKELQGPCNSLQH